MVFSGVVMTMVWALLMTIVIVNDPIIGIVIGDNDN